MKKAIFHRYGAPCKVIECVDTTPLKPPSDWEVTVAIKAASINPSDVSVLRGKYGKLPAKFPATPGLEASGEVIAVGNRIKDFSPGERVIVVANNNWTQRRNVPATALYKMPDWLSYEQAAMVKVNAGCALIMLERFGGDLRAGEFIIQNAPLSSVGRMLSVFASEAGLYTVNIVRREESLNEIYTRHGDMAIVDSEYLPTMVAEATASAPIALGFDAVAGDASCRIADCLEHGATLVNYGMLSGEACLLRADQTIFKDIRLRGFWLLKTLGSMNYSERQALFDKALSVMKKHNVEFPVYKHFPLTQIGDAIEASESDERVGKVLVLPNGDDI